MTASIKELPNLASDIRKLMDSDDVLPPVEGWSPENEGEVDIRIARDGNWFYRGTIMERSSVVRLFSRILRRDGDAFFLVTPVEKLQIVVEDAPFIVRMMDVEGKDEQQVVFFSTNVGDNFVLSQAHPMRCRLNEQGESIPYVQVRRNLMARLSRPVYYQLTELAVESPSRTGAYGIWSDSKFFEM